MKSFHEASKRNTQTNVTLSYRSCLNYDINLYNSVMNENNMYICTIQKTLFVYFQNYIFSSYLFL